MAETLIRRAVIGRMARRLPRDRSAHFVGRRPVEYVR